MKIRNLYIFISIFLFVLIIWGFAFPLGIKHTLSGNSSLFYDLDKQALVKKRIFNLSNKNFYAFVEGKKINQETPKLGGVKQEEIEKKAVRVYANKDKSYEESMRLILKFASEVCDKLYPKYKPDTTDVKFINPQNFENLVFNKSDEGKESFKQVKDNMCKNCIHIVTSNNLFSEKSSFYKNWDDSHVIFLNDGNKTNPRVFVHELGHFVFDKIEMDGEGGHITSADSTTYYSYNHHLMSVIDGPFNYFIDPSFLLSEYIDHELLSTNFYFPFAFEELENPFECEKNTEEITDNCLNAIIDYYGVDSIKFNALQEENAALYNNIRDRSLADEGSYRLAVDFDSQNVKTGGLLSWFINGKAAFDPYNIVNNEKYSLADFKWMIVRLAPNLTDDEHIELARLHFESFYNRRVEKLNLWKIKIELDKPEPIIDTNGVQLEGDELVDFVIENTELIDFSIVISNEPNTTNPDSPGKPQGTVINVISDTLKINDLPVSEKEEKKRQIENRVDFKKQIN